MFRIAHVDAVIGECSMDIILTVMSKLSDCSRLFAIRMPIYVIRILFLISISHCEKKLARLLFDFGIVNTTDDDCEQQFPSVHSVYNSYQVINTGGETTVVFGLKQLWSDDKVDHDAILRFAHIFNLKPEYLSRGACWGGFECGSSISDTNFQLDAGM